MAPSCSFPLPVIMIDLPSTGNWQLCMYFCSRFSQLDAKVALYFLSWVQRYYFCFPIFEYKVYLEGYVYQDVYTIFKILSPWLAWIAKMNVQTEKIWIFLYLTRDWWLLLDVPLVFTSKLCIIYLCFLWWFQFFYSSKSLKWGFICIHG